MSVYEAMYKALWFSLSCLCFDINISIDQNIYGNLVNYNMNSKSLGNC